MFKKLRFLYILLFATTPAFAQITLTNSVFPQAGDILYSSPDSATPGAQITSPSNVAQDWDFSNFIPAFADTTFVLDASQGQVADLFPEAEIVIPVFAGEGYFINSGDSLILLGFFGDAGFGIPLAVQASDPQVQYAVPATYGTTFADAFDFTQAIDPQDFPELAAILPAFPPIDSVRAVYTSERRDTIDAFGNLSTYIGTFEVLRQKRVDYTNLAIEFKSFGIWVDPGVIGFDLGLGGPDTTTTYQFFNDQFPEPIASVSADSADVITSIVYKVDPDLLTSVEEVNTLDGVLSVFPNPFGDAFSIQWDAQAGNYEFRVFNSLGLLISRKEEQVLQGDQIQINLPVGDPGLTVLQILSEDGKILYQEKLVRH